MASAETNTTDVKQKLKDLTECSICLETYNEPKILPCIHTFCQKCLEETAARNGKNPEENMLCPMCRKEFTIPVDGVASLPKNFFVGKLIELSKMFNPLSDSFPCEVCQEEIVPTLDTNLPPVSMYCVDCQENMCMKCSAGHKKYKVSKNHRLIELKSSEKDLMESVLSPNVCEKHEKKPIDVFCSNCMEALCSFCFLESHKTHEWSTIDEVVGKFRDQILENNRSLLSVQSNLEQRQREFEVSRSEFLKNMEGIESEVERRRMKLKEIVDKDADSLLSQIHKLTQETLKENEAKKGDIETLIISVNSFKTYCELITTKGSASDICSAVNNLNTRADELKHNHVVLEDRLSQARNLLLNFKKMQLQESLEQNIKDNVIGRLRETTNDDEEEHFFETTE